MAAQINFISECFVNPKHQPEASKQPYHLSPPDVAMLSIDPIQKGLLFSLHNNPSSNTIPHFLENLKYSLSLALVHFYPLAGRFVLHQYPDEHACSISIDCSKGLGARLIHATCLNFSVSDITSPKDVPSIVRSFFDLGEKTVNFDATTKPILSIQVTELKDGLFIGFTMNHSVVDGTSFIHFITTLSEIFNLRDNISKISRVPIFGCKPWIDDKNDNDNEAILKLPYLEPEEFIDHGFEPGPLRERIFHFSRKSLEELKDKVNKECGGSYVISSFQALTVFVWKAITLARDLSSEEMTTCNILINARGRYVPPLSDNCFGNFIGGAQWGCKVDELLGHDLGWAAKNIREALIAQDGKTIVDMYKMLVKSPIVVRRGVIDLHGQNCVVFGGSASFDMYGPEFGFGRAVAARMGYANKEDGKVTANPGRDGGGSVDLEICLKPEYMDRLEANSDFMSFVTLG